MSTNGACARGPNRWMSRATRPLPLPVSPWIRMRGGRDARADASRSLSTCPRTSTIAGLSPSSSAPSVIGAPPLRSGLGAALRDRPRELADQPRIALLGDLESSVSWPGRLPDPFSSQISTILPELDPPVVTGDGAFLDGIGAGAQAEQRVHGLDGLFLPGGPLRRRRDAAVSSHRS